MTNQRKHGKHSAALPETQQTSARARETEARTGVMTHRELEEKFATKEELKQSVKFLIERVDHENQLHSQQLQSVETNLTQKIDANEARDVERFSELRSDMNRQFEASEARDAEFRSDIDKQFEASAARIIEKLNEFKSELFRYFAARDKIDEESKKAKEKFDEERTKRLESTIEQQYEKNLYKTAFLVVVLGGSLSGLTYGVYQLVKFLTGG